MFLEAALEHFVEVHKINYRYMYVSEFRNQSRLALITLSERSNLIFSFLVLVSFVFFFFLLFHILFLFCTAAHSILFLVVFHFYFFLFAIEPGN